MSRVGVKRRLSVENDLQDLPPVKRRTLATERPNSESGGVVQRLVGYISSAASFLHNLFFSPSPPPNPLPTHVPSTESPHVPPSTHPETQQPREESETSSSLHQKRASTHRATAQPLKATVSRSPVILKELQAAQEQKLYGHILLSQCHAPSPPRSPSPPRTPSLFTPHLRSQPEVIGPSSSLCEEPIGRKGPSYLTHSVPHRSSHPHTRHTNPWKTTTTTHYTPSSPLHTHTSNTRPLSQTSHYSELRGTPPVWRQRSSLPREHAAILVPQRKTVENKEIQTSPELFSGSLLSTLRCEEARQMREWLEGLKADHRHAAADRKIGLEVAEKYMRLCREERERVEDARVARLRRELGLVTIAAPKDSQEMFLEMTPEQREKVRTALGPGPGNQMFSERYSIRITRADLSTLSQLNWLNDEVINFYFNLIAERGREEEGRRRVHSMSSFFYPKLMQTGYSGVRRWTRKVDLFSHDIVLLPIHLGMHWCLAAIDFQNKYFHYYDSLGGQNPSCLARLRDYLVAEAQDKKKMTYDLSQWQDHTPLAIPHQHNGSDCGVFTCMLEGVVERTDQVVRLVTAALLPECLHASSGVGTSPEQQDWERLASRQYHCPEYARFLASDIQFTFSQQEMPRIREHMVCEILQQRLF